jgi:CubicO group peptidase (beta-lactamase class C family)
VTRTRKIILLATTTLCGALALSAVYAQQAPRVVTGFVSHTLCSAAFVSGLDPDQLYAETLDAMPGTGLISWALAYRMDRERRQVTTTLLGGAESRAVYRQDLGCRMSHGADEIADATPPAQENGPARASLPEIAGPAVVAPASPELAAALDRAFAEPEKPLRRTKAIVVVKDGRIVAERYAAGYGVDTPIHGFSATKSVTSALIGILVRQGRLAVDQPAPVAAWQRPDDPRHAITVDQLLRHTAGLAMGSSLQASLGSALEPVNRMKYLERDMAGFAESSELATAPGTAWNYHDGNYVILSRLIRDAAGGRAADVVRFARRELFGPLGMRSVTLETDATGTPDGSSQMLAPARDWARFGLLYLDDGIVGGKRILPEGWVKYSAAATPNAWVGYGAGFWTNLGDSFGATYRIEHGWPRDAFFAKGTIGKYVIVIPSARLVIVRMGTSPNGPPEADGTFRLVADIVAATGKGDVAQGN